MWSILTSPEDTFRFSRALFFSANKEEVEVLSMWTTASIYLFDSVSFLCETFWRKKFLNFKDSDFILFFQKYWAISGDHKVLE